MKNAKMLTILVLGLMVSTAEVSKAEPVGTAWTYQGRLMDANSAADGEYDFEFKLFDDPCTGAQRGSTIEAGDLDVMDGYFTVELDFGSVFDGNGRWLETAVRPGDSNDPNAFVTLIPRQEVTPTPYALYAASGPATDWNNLANMPSGFDDDIDNDSGGDITAVNAGMGLNGGGTSGDVTLNVDVPLSLSGSVTYPGAVINGTNTGPGYGVQGRNDIYGNYGCLGSTIYAVYGYGDYGVYGENRSGNFGYLGSSGYGACGRHSNNNTGVLGTSNYGVYGKSAAGYAGYFDGDVKITGALTVNNMPYGDYKNVQWNDSTKQIGYDNSSKRFKENIKPIKDDFSKILSVTPRTYTRPGNPGRWEVGYIAEEFVEAGLEKLVWFEDEEHTIPDGINYEKIILYTNEIVKANRQAIQELQRKVAKQQAEKEVLIAAQDKQIEYLQKEVAQLKNLMKNRLNGNENFFERVKQ